MKTIGTIAYIDPVTLVQMERLHVLKKQGLPPEKKIISMT